MSIDLKGNTNYVAFHDLEQGLVVPRTNLSAVDMNVGNGLEVSGDTINIREADAIQIVNGASTNAVITSDALRKALFMGSTSILDVTKQTVTASAGSITSTFDSDGMVVNGSSVDGVGGIKFVGPLAGMSEREGKFLLVFDVYVSVNGAITGFSCTGDSGIVFETIPGYTLSKTEQGSWVRCAALVDTTAGVYAGSLYFNVSTTSNTEYSFKLGNVRVQDATGLNSDEIQYLVLAGKINTTVDGATVVVDGNNQYVFIPGEGVKIQEGVISMDTSKAPAADLINNTDDLLVSTKNLNAALSSGKAVDVTSTPNASIGTPNIGIGIKGHITWTTSSGAKFGFYETNDLGADSPEAFPKYAPGLVYLMLANVTNTGTANVTLTAENAINGTLPTTIPPGRMVRVAFLFYTSITGYMTVTSTGSISLAFDYLREYEVTGCSTESRNYIAKLANPDAYNDYYLVDEDEVNPWLPIINMKDSPVTTIAAGLAYKLYANDGAMHTLMVDTIPPNTYGRDAHIELFIANADSSINLVSPLRMAYGNSFTANKLHNCSVQFQDGLATLTVNSIEDIFVVNLAGSTYTTESGTLYYGLATDTGIEIAFNSDTNNEECDLYNATANGAKKLYGNGVDNTIIVGSGTFGANSIELHELQLKGATISGTAISVADTLAVKDSLTNNAAITFGTASTLFIVGSSTATSAITGTGSLTFSNGAVIDASQNETGGIVAGSATSTLTIPSSSSITFRGIGNYSVTILGSRTNKYLLANGNFVSSLYTVENTNASGSGSLEYGLATSTETTLVFSHAVDGSTISFTSNPWPRASLNLLGNGTDKTIVTLPTTTAGSSNPSVMYGLTITGSTVRQVGLGSTTINCAVTNNVGNRTGSDGGTYVMVTPANAKLFNCLFENNDSTDFGRSFLQVSNGSVVEKCTFKTTEAWSYGFQGVTMKDSIFIDCGWRLNCGTNTGDATVGSTVSGCSFTGTSSHLALPLSGGVNQNPIYIKDCTFDAFSDVGNLYGPDHANRYGLFYLSSINKIDSTVYGISSLTLASNSVLNLSENANDKVVFNAANIEVPSGTAYIYPYGSSVGVDSPIEVTGATLGNTMLNTGKIGYLVGSTASTTATGTLYDALVGGGTIYSNIIFDPDLNGKTIYCAALTNDSTETQTIYGNGPENTILGSSLQRNYSKIINFENLTISPIMNVRGDFKNIVFTGGSSVTQYASTLYVYRSSSNSHFPFITNCVFKDTNAPNYKLVQAAANSYIDMINCLVTGNTVGWCLMCNGVSNNPSRVTLTGCTFTNNTFNSYAYENSYAALSSITDCVFDSGNNIKITGGSVTLAGTNIINSTISGAGTIVFANNAVLDLTANTNAAVISGGTITVATGSTASIIPYGGGTPVSISGSGTTLSNMGVLS